MAQPGDEELFTFLHSTQRVPTIVLFTSDIPDWAVDPNPGTSKDEYARKPLPPEALVYRLQAMLIHNGREVPGGLPTTTAEGTEIETIGEGTVVSLFAPKGGVGKTMIAVNLAVAIRQQTGDSVCLMDADVGVGNVTAVLNAPYHGGLAAPRRLTAGGMDQRGLRIRPSPPTRRAGSVSSPGAPSRASPSGSAPTCWSPPFAGRAPITAG